MSKVTQLASGHITAGDRLSIELLKPTTTPPVVLLKWPQAAATICRRSGLPATTSFIMSTVKAAVTKLAMIRDQEQIDQESC